MNQKMSELKGTSDPQVHPHIGGGSAQCFRMSELVGEPGIRSRSPDLPSILRHSFLLAAQYGINELSNNLMTVLNILLIP